MHNINTINNLSLDKQREKLLELNPDIIYGVYRKIESNSSEIKLELVEDIMTCYPNRLKNLNIPQECDSINLVNLGTLRKGNIDFLKGNNTVNNPEELILLSNGVLEFIEGNSGKKHFITTLRDGGAADPLQRTTTAGRNSSYNLNEEVEREHYEEGPFLGKNDKGEYCLAIPEGNVNGKKYTSESILSWLENKYNLDSSNPDHDQYINMFEKSFPGIKYEELGDILRDIVKNERFINYQWEKSEIEGTFDDIKNIHIQNGVQNFIKAYTFFDKDNNTLEYRDIRKIKGVPDGFHLLGNRPCKLFLESQKQYPKLTRIENAYKDAAVPTIEQVSKKTEAILKGKNIQDIILRFLEENKEKSLNDYDWDKLQSSLNQSWDTLHKRKSKLKKDPIEVMYKYLVYSSDSSVFSIDDNHVLKIYDSHSAEDIKRYHKLQNLLSESSYTIEKSGDVNGTKFDNIEFSILRLNSELVFGDNEHCFSIVDKINPNNSLLDVNLDDNSTFTKDFLKFNDLITIQIMDLIENQNPYNLKTDKDIHGMNFMVKEVKDGTLKIIITDLGNHIESFLKENIDAYI